MSMTTTMIATTTADTVTEALLFDHHRRRLPDGRLMNRKRPRRKRIRRQGVLMSACVAAAAAMAVAGIPTTDGWIISTTPTSSSTTTMTRRIPRTRTSTGCTAAVPSTMSASSTHVPPPPPFQAASHNQKRHGRVRSSNMINKRPVAHAAAGTASADAHADPADSTVETDARHALVAVVEQQQQSMIHCTTRRELESKLYTYANEMAGAAAAAGTSRGVVDRDNDDDRDKVRNDDVVVLSSLHMNVTTTAFRRLANIVYLEHKKKRTRKVNVDDEESSPPTSTLLSTLIKTIARKMMSKQQQQQLQHQTPQQQQQQLEIHPTCLSDTLQAMSLLSRIDGDDGNASVGGRTSKFRPLAIKVVKALNDIPPNDLYRIGSTRLVQTLQSMNELGLFMSSSTKEGPTSIRTASTFADRTDDDDDITSSCKLLTTILLRLMKPDAVSKLPPKIIIHGLLTMLDVLPFVMESSSSTIQIGSGGGGCGGGDGADFFENGHVKTKTMSLVVVRSFMRRLIKTQMKQHDVVSIDEWCRILTALQQHNRALAGSVDKQHHHHHQHHLVVDMKNETDRLINSVLHIVLKARQHGVDGDASTGEGHHSTRRSDVARWTPIQFCTFVSSWSSVTPNQRDTATLGTLLETVMKDGTLQLCSFWKLSDVAYALTAGGRDDNFETKESITTIIVNDHPDFITAMELQFQKLIEADSGNGYTNVPTDETLNKILRWFVVTRRRRRQQIHEDNTAKHDIYPFSPSLHGLLSHRSYIQNCELDQLSSFLWFLGSASPSSSSTDASEDDERLDAILCISERLLEIESMEPNICSPRLASGILSYFTSAVSKLPNSSRLAEDVHFMSSHVFNSFGPTLLLSHSLSSAEASRALKAYADAVTFSYDDHKGIIDHLVGILASPSVTHKCTTRQLAESLWSCGKMVVWESKNDISPPPYLTHALVLADELASRSQGLTSSDTAQSIWALGRLDVRNNHLMSVLASRTIEEDADPGFVEISNILWGMCQVQFRDVRILDGLVERTKILMNTEDVETREASSILYSLANLGFRDKQVFDDLANKIVAQIDSTSAQSVANTLYAFRTVQLPPPSQLLELWARDTLGLEGIVPLAGNLEPRVELEEVSHYVDMDEC